MLPTITQATIGTVEIETVNARDLHAFLEVRRDFTTWIKDRLDTYGFTQDTDFVTYSVSPNSGENLGGRSRTEYAITLDTAKELAMVERTDKGRQARRYFIECERRAKTAASTPALPQTLPEALRLAADLAEKVTEQSKAIAVLTPRSEALATIADGEGSFCIRDAAKMLQTSETGLRSYLTAHGWIYRRETAAPWIARAERLAQKWLTTKIVDVQTGDGRVWKRPQARVTCAGLVVLAQRLGKPVPPEALQPLPLIEAARPHGGL